MASMNPMDLMNGMTPEQMDIARQQRLADLLRGQAQEPTTGQMVSGHYIPPSWTQQLASVLGNVAASQADRKATSLAKDYADKYRQDTMSTMQRYAEALRGKPEQNTVSGMNMPSQQAANEYSQAADTTGQFDLSKPQPLMPGMQGQQSPLTSIPGYAPAQHVAAQPGNPQDAASVLMASQNPNLQAAGMKQLMSLNQPPKWTVGERFNMQTGMPEKVIFDANNPANVMPFGGQQAPKLEAVNGQMVNPYTAKPQGAPIPKQPDLASDLLIPDGQGGYRLNDQLVQAKKDIARSGAANISNTIGKQESEESKTIGKGFGEEYISTQKAGQMANGKIARYQRLSQLLDGVNTGKLTPMGTELASAAQSLGLNVDPKLGNKQAAAALSNEMALSLRNPSGGAGMPGALSDKDREFLTGMVPGIDKTPQGRRMMTDSAIALAKRDIEVARLMREYRMKNGHIDDGFYQQLQQYSDSHPLFEGKSPIPAATLPGGWTVKEH